MNYRDDRWRAALILGLACIFSLVWFGRYLEFSPVVSVDLPGHVALIERLAANLRHGRIFFYDHWWFGGWPAYQFYGFAGHLATLLLVPLTTVLSREPVQLAVNIVMLLGCAALPASVYAAASSIAFQKNKQESLPRFSRSIIALTSAVVSFWYLNQPLEFFGVGAGSLWHGGLYLQIFAWHLSLLLWAVLFELVHDNRPLLMVLATVVLTALILTHIFAAVFSLLLAGLIFLRFDQARGRLLLVIFLSAALSAFWWLPMAVTAGDYSLEHSEPPQGDLFEMVVHQPFAAFALGLVKLLRLQFTPVEIVPLLLMLIALAAISSRRFWSSPSLVAGSLFSLLLFAVLSSPYIAASFPLGLHYYRFSSLLLLFLLTLCAASSLELFRQPAEWKLERIVRSAYLVLCVLSLAMTAAIGELRGRAVSKTNERNSFRAQHQVLATLRSSGELGRVAFEYFRDRKIFPFLSPHFMESTVAAMAGRETTNGLFIQSSLSTQFVAASMKALGFDAYRVPVPWTEEQVPDRSLALRHLRDAGIGQLVVSTLSAEEALLKDTGQEGTKFNPYRIMSLSLKSPPLIEKEDRRVVTYTDRSGGLPFAYVENIFYRDADLYRRTILLAGEVNDLLSLHGSVPLSHARQGAANELLFQLPSDALPYIERLIARRTFDTSELLARELERKILPQLRSLPEAPEPTSAPEVAPEIEFSPEQQVFYLKNLEPGEMYRVAYSYFPYFRPIGGKLFRALGEQMLVVPEGSSMSIEYARLSDPTVLFSTLVSCAALGALFIIMVWGRLRVAHHERIGAEPELSEKLDE